MEDSISGFKVESSWDDIVEHGEKITEALKNISSVDESSEDFKEWEKWRPKISERNDEVREKTAELASIDSNDSAEKRINETQDGISNMKNSSEKGKWLKTTLKSSYKLIRHYVIETISFFEEIVYKNISTKTSPSYLDNELISANLSKKLTMNGKENKYSLEVNINDEKLKDEVREYLDSYNETKRWHIEADVDDEVSSAVDGVDTEETTEG